MPDRNAPATAGNTTPDFRRSRAVHNAAKATAIVLPLILSGCSMTPTQKKWTAVAASVLVVGAIAAHDSDYPEPPSAGRVQPSLPCRMQPDESCR